jgi:hypothetical protein
MERGKWGEVIFYGPLVGNAPLEPHFWKKTLIFAKGEVKLVKREQYRRETE